MTAAVDEGELTPIWELVPGRHQLRVAGEWLLLIAVYPTQRHGQVRLEVHGGRMFVAQVAAERRARVAPSGGPAS